MTSATSAEWQNLLNALRGIGDILSPPLTRKQRAIARANRLGHGALTLIGKLLGLLVLSAFEVGYWLLASYLVFALVRYGWSTTFPWLQVGVLAVFVDVFGTQLWKGFVTITARTWKKAIEA